jgi:hypothetical protein
VGSLSGLRYFVEANLAQSPDRSGRPSDFGTKLKKLVRPNRGSREKFPKMYDYMEMIFVKSLMMAESTMEVSTQEGPWHS